MSVAQRVFASAFLGVVLGAAVPPGVAPGAAAEAVTVIVKKTSVRRDRQFYAPAVGEAAYGDRLAVVGTEGDWVRVTAGAVTGWVHASAVTEKRFKVEGKLAGPGSSGPPGDEDVALAGKGFNPQVEQEYRRKNPGAGYGAVDRMEKLAVSEQAIAEFVREGHLAPRGAAK